METAKITASRHRRHGRDAEQTAFSREHIFQVRCETRAILSALGELGLQEAVDALQNAAVATGLVDEIGQDAVQATTPMAFKESHYVV